MRIPVVVLTTSEADADILTTYGAHANCYITKPVDMDRFVDIVKFLEEFWFTVVKLPAHDTEL
jgi:DNA-binding NarL/FixJ family response regulator